MLHQNVPIRVALSNLEEIWVMHRNHHRGGGAVSLSVGPTSGRLGVRIPAATDLSRKNR